MGIIYDIPTGLVFVRNFDQGVIETLGAYIDVDLNGEGKRNYFIDIPACTPMKVPVIFSKPYQVMENKILPSFTITRGSFAPAMQRWHSIGQQQYRVGVGDPTAVTLANDDVVSGYENYECHSQAMPYDIPYTITVQSRYEHECIPMLKKVLSVYKPYSRLLLKDSLGQTRSYTVFAEGAVSDISDLIDVSNRTKAYQYEIRVEGELDLGDPVINPSALELIERTHRIK